MTEATRAWLRALPSFPDDLPGFDVDAAPAEPVELFLEWLRDVVDAGTLAAHACTVSTSDADGVVTARVLVLKDVEPGRWRIATPTGGLAGTAALRNPHAALTFFWPTVGRQVKVGGSIALASREVAIADYRARPGVPDDLDPELVPSDWAVWTVEPESVEFWQAAHSRDHIRLRYLATADGWSRARPQP